MTRCRDRELAGHSGSRTLAPSVAAGTTSRRLKLAQLDAATLDQLEHTYPRLGGLGVPAVVIQNVKRLIVVMPAGTLSLQPTLHW